MYILCELSDSFQIEPSKLNFVLANLIDQINTKYQNRMIENKGLGVVLYDIVSMTNTQIEIATGNAHYLVTFRFVVFQPFVDELIEGKVLRSLPTGIQVSLNFTDSVFIDQCYFPENSDFDEDEQLWYWNYNDVKFMLYIGATIRFKVHHVVMKKQQSIKPATVPSVFYQEKVVEKKNEMKEENDENGEKKEDEEEKMVEEDVIVEEDKLPMKVFGRINENGLGLTAWWNAN